MPLINFSDSPFLVEIARQLSAAPQSNFATLPSVFVTFSGHQSKRLLKAKNNSHDAQERKYSK
jgi:hypothetical protein